MSKLKVNVDETLSLVQKLKNEMEQLFETEETIQNCIEILSEQKSPKVVSKLYDNAKDLKKSLNGVKEDNILKTIEIIENGVNEFDNSDYEAAIKVGEDS